MEARPCTNHEFCNGTAPGQGINSQYCMTCGSWFKVGGFGWDRLTIVDNTDGDCVICFQPCARKLIFPAGCGHSFCLNCSRDILLFDETRYGLSPVPFGCPPCPNGCVNPVRGKQCYCYEYDPVQEQWKNEQLGDWTRWNTAEHASIDHSNDDADAFGSGRCPLCRTKYERIQPREDVNPRRWTSDDRN